MKHKKIFLWLSGIAVVAFLAFALGWQDIAASIINIHPAFLAVLCMTQLITLGIAVHRWQFLLGKMKKRLSFSEVFSIYMAGNFIESVTPSVKLGGEAAKLFLFNRKTALDFRRLTAILLTEKFISLLPFIFLSSIVLCSAFMYYKLPSVTYISFVFLCIIFVPVYFLSQGKTALIDNRFINKLKSLPLIHKPAVKALNFLKEALHHSKSLISAKERHRLLLLSLFVWIFYPLKVYLAAYALGFNINIVNAAVITFTVYLISMIPLLPGGLGTFEGSMALMFSLSGLSPAEGFAVALTSRLITYWFPLLISSVSAGLIVFSQSRITDSSKYKSSAETI